MLFIVFKRIILKLIGLLIIPIVIWAYGSGYLINDINQQYLILFFLTIIAICMVTFTIIFSTSQKLVTSIHKIAKVVQHVTYGNLNKRVSIKKGELTEELATNINLMIDALQERENGLRICQIESHEQKEHFEAIFNSITDAIITVSKNCKIIKANPTFCIWLGLTEQELENKYLPDFLQCECEIDCINLTDIGQHCPFITQNERLCPTEASVKNQHTNIKKFLSISSSPISGIKGEQTFVIVLRDITEFKEISKMRSDFIATLSHDLRVPILAEANTLKFMQKGLFDPLSEKQETAVENLLNSNNDLLNQVNCLLDTYKYESTNIELHKESINLYKLANECIKDLTPLVHKNNQTIENNISQNIPNVYIDKSEIKRVFLNIINNAINYSSKDERIIIDAEFKEPDDFVTVKILDNGRGIPDEELEQIFDRFFSKAKKFRKIGTGLGLYLSKQIIEKHNGEISAESIVGKGSTFFFTLKVNK